MASLPPTPSSDTGAVGYHLLVAAVFAGCLPMAVAEAVRTPGGARPFAAALDTARSTVAHAYSLPG